MMKTAELEKGIEAFVQYVACRVAEQIAKGRLAAVSTDGVKQRRSDEQMRCRHKWCRRRSKGPRFHYLCEKHLKRTE